MSIENLYEEQLRCCLGPRSLAHWEMLLLKRTGGLDSTSNMKQDFDNTAVLTHELAFMFTKEACNLWTESYLLLLKINSAGKALHEEEKMPKSRTVAHLGLLHRHDGCCCFLTVFSSPHGCEILLDAVSAPQSWALKRKQGWEGTVSGLETQDESCRIQSNDRAERKTARGLCMLLVPWGWHCTTGQNRRVPLAFF